MSHKVFRNYYIFIILVAFFTLRYVAKLVFKKLKKVENHWSNDYLIPRTEELTVQLLITTCFTSYFVNVPPVDKLHRITKKESARNSLR
jgi:hypothetical protein